MIGIKLKVLKRSGTLHDLTGSYSLQTSARPLNGVEMGSACEYSHIRYQIKGLGKNLRKYDLIVVFRLDHPDLQPKWAHLGPT